jgi:hypothetical protein
MGAGRELHPQIKNPAFDGGVNFSFFKRGNCSFGYQIQTFYCYWIWIFLLFLLLFFWRLNPVCIDFPVAVSSYTSLGQDIQSKSYATRL